MTWLRRRASNIRKRWFSPLQAELERNAASAAAATADLARSLDLLAAEGQHMRFGVASLQARVGDYPASNTRFLLEHDNWAGLIIDRGTEHVDLVKRTALGWRSAHSSTLYFGASISALEHWGREHGYRLVGSSSEGVNAFLVRDDVAGDLPGLAGAEAWRETLVRQARNSTGELTYFGGLAEQPAPIAEMPLIDVVTGRELLVSDLQ